MPLLGKPDGGERCVAKSPMLYRTWNRCRRSHIKAWEDSAAASFDMARAGSSASKAAATKAYYLETAHTNGKKAAALLWDLHKYFDSVSVQVLTDRAAKVGYPALDLAMGAQMHMAPRVFQNQGHCSKGTVVSRSILAGCSHAIPFTRAFMNSKIQRVQKEVDDVDVGVYVDDVAQSCRGGANYVLEKLGEAGILFASSMNNLKMKISSTSVWLQECGQEDQGAAR
jgi:hypothetical protein